QRALRTPNVIELFASQNRGLVVLPQNANGSYDPCSGATPFATQEQCARTGVTTDQYGTIVDYLQFFPVLTGGNPDLEPEEGKTLSYGVVFEPTFARGLLFSVDFFDIKVEKMLGTVEPSLALNGCLNTGDPFFCSLIHRGESGTL